MIATTESTGALAAAPGQAGRAKAEAVAGEFEQILIQQMVTGLRKTTSLDGEDGGLFGKGAGTDTYNDWFDAHLSQHLTQSGGIGVRDTLLRDMERLGQIPSAEHEVVDPTHEPSTPRTLDRQLQNARQPLPPRQLPVQLPSALGASSTTGGLHAFA